MKHEYHNPQTLPDWSGMFSQVVVTEKNGLKFIHISGQVGVDQTKKLVGDGSFSAQTRQALVNLRLALDSVGVSVQDVVKLIVYVVDYEYEQAGIIREELRAVFPLEQLPALSLLGVAALAEKHFLIEIDAEVIAESSFIG
ncbi:RidA family protein [Haliscomenobacter sp.]|uniref:RidA family protein n=1 Tax=Haliscomenobacter sp. TaxID=2717303 RepID=UPI00359391FF